MSFNFARVTAESPPLATDRLTVKENGDLIYQMKRKFSDGTQAILLSPMELIGERQLGFDLCHPERATEAD